MTDWEAATFAKVSFRMTGALSEAGMALFALLGTAGKGDENCGSMERI
jgi:hypothetical protein